MQVKIYFVFSKRALNIYGTHGVSHYTDWVIFSSILAIFSSRERAASSQKMENPRRSIPRNHVICRLANW